jgi:hypothetical protein
MTTQPETTRPAPTSAPPGRCPLPHGSEIYLTNDPRGHWRGELHAGRRRLEHRGDCPEAVVAELVHCYAVEAGTPSAAPASASTC